MSNPTANESMLEMFLFEATSLLEQLDEILLACEKSQEITDDDVNEVFRIMHTIKGSSAMMEFGGISSITHKLEDCFYFIRENGIEHRYFTQLFDLMLDATDFLKGQLELIQSGGPLTDEGSPLEDRAAAFYALLSQKPEDTVLPEAAAEPGGPLTRYHIDIQFEEDCGMENLRAFMLVTELEKSCRILHYEPEDIETNPECAVVIAMSGFFMLVETTLESEALRELVESSQYVRAAAVTAGAEAAQAPSITGERYQALVTFEQDCGMENLRAFMLLNTLRSQCGIVSFFPPDIETNSDTAHYITQNGFQIVLETPLSPAVLQQLIRESAYVSSATIIKEQPAAPAEAAPASETAPEPALGKTNDNAPAPTAPGGTRPVRQNLINVSLSKLDELMDLMGELVITESMVTRSPDLKNIDKLDNFNKAARQLRKLTDELQDMVMSVRMVPVSGTFRKMQRIVRDMCRSLGKSAELVTMGEETDIDKTIIDGIADPIMHLVRNSMDHGVELPEDRVAAGKPAKATITLSAQNTGGEILVTVSDDGKGLDAEAILAKARRQGLLTRPATEYSEKEIFQFLMQPGFSTKEEVTEYSGRGVGMDVVKKNIEKIGGAVVIESKKGQGMSVFLKIPLTLAIVDGMDISVGGGTYTLQITAINQSFKATADQIITNTEGKEMIMLRGEVYPIIRLHQLYQIPNAITDIEKGIMIWVQADDRSVCLFVDQLIGEQQIVVKPLPPYLNRYNVKSCGISGCTILGDGNISLILDVGGIIDAVNERRYF